MTTSTVRDADRGAEAWPGGAPKRINVAINAEMLSAIDRMVDWERVTLTEAVRRLVTSGDRHYWNCPPENPEMIIRPAEVRKVRDCHRRSSVPSRRPVAVAAGPGGGARSDEPPADGHRIDDRSTGRE